MERKFLVDEEGARWRGSSAREINECDGLEILNVEDCD